MSGIARKLLHGGAWSLSAKILAAFSTLTVNVFLARTLDPDSFGLFVLLASLAMFFAVVSSVGLNPGLVRLIAAALARERLGEARWLIRTGALTSLIGWALASTIYLCGLDSILERRVFDAPGLADLSVFAIAWFGLRTATRFLSGTFRGLTRLREASLFENALPMVLALVALLFFHFMVSTWNLRVVLTLYLAGFAIAVSIGLWLVFGVARSLAESEAGSWKSVFRVCLPLMIMSIGVFFMNEAHVWVVGALLPESQVAVYGATKQLIRVIAFPLLVVNSVVPPFVARFHVQGETEKMQHMLRSTASVAVFPGLLVFAVVAVFSEQLLGGLFGDFYRSGATALIVMALGQAINVATGSPSVVLAMTGRQNVLMWLAILSGILGVGISLLLTPHFGILGAAIGMASGQIMHNVTMMFVCRWHLNVQTQMYFLFLPNLLKDTLHRLGKSRY